MKYKLISKVNPHLKPIEQVLLNRGIPYVDLKMYLNTTDEMINSPLMFGEDLMREATAALIKTIQANRKAILIVDSDCDGFTSSAILLNYLHLLFPAWVENNLIWILHEGKEHGLKDMDIEAWINQEIALVICPDSASNDYEEHHALSLYNIPVIVLDHHEADKVSPNAIVINNQLSSYPNKELSGAGVTWQFCRYIDMLFNSNHADKFLDLVALGLDADMMSLREKETKHLINKGFKDENVVNPFIAGMAWKNSFSLGSKITPIGAAFYIAPFVNAMVRSGTMEEKELLFKSMLTYEAFKKVPSTKRGHKPGDEETIVDQALRVATNVKNRQTKAQDAGMAFLENLIERNNMLDGHKALLFLLKSGQIDKNIAGLCANKIMAKYQRPCCILTEVPNIEVKNGETISIQTVYQGSARGYDKSGVDNFKGICESTGLTTFVAGHPEAFGLGIEEDNVVPFLEATDEALEQMSSEPCYLVDYIFENKDIDGNAILEIGSFDELWGKDVDEPYVAVKDLKITKDMVTFMKGTTIKISLPNDISLIKFNSTQEEYEQFLVDGYVLADFIGRCNKNDWGGKVRPQIKIEDYEIFNVVKYDF